MTNYAYRLLGGEPRPGHEVLPVWKRFGRSSQGQAWSFYGIAALCGIIVQALIFTSRSSRFSRATGDEQPQCSIFGPTSVPALVNEAYTRPGSGQHVVSYENRWSLGALYDMVSRTKGYYARDYSLWLGWNNMRYIIETAALHARLLNRTLVIPSYVYARSCEWKIEVCAAYATMVNRGDATGDGEWSELPLEKQMGWKIPIQAMLDLDTLRNHVPVVTVAQYLQLHELSETLETGDGHWDSHAYNSTSIPSSLAIIPNYEYDKNLNRTARVDKLPERQIQPPPAESREWEIYGDLVGLLTPQGTINAEAARRFLNTTCGEDWQSDSEMVKIVSKYGFAVVYTYDGPTSLHSKTVDRPVSELVPADIMRGFIDDFGHYAEDVLLVQGEIHSDRKPGSMTFTSPTARDNYTDFVLRGFNHVPSIRLLADAVAEHMRELNNGRMWMAGHWRRGDFVRLGWHVGTPAEAVGLILSRLREGAERLRKFRDGEGFLPPQAPGTTPDQSFKDAGLPLPGDRWFLATDERNPAVLAIALAKNATLFSDLVKSTPQLRRLLGWPMLYTDVLALVEQEVMARSAFFFGYRHSSVAGGVVNLRTALGMDPRAMTLEGF